MIFTIQPKFLRPADNEWIPNGNLVRPGEVAVLDGSLDVSERAHDRKGPARRAFRISGLERDRPGPFHRNPQADRLDGGQALEPTLVDVRDRVAEAVDGEHLSPHPAGRPDEPRRRKPDPLVERAPE